MATKLGMLGKKFRAYYNRRLKANKELPDFKKLVLQKIAVAVLQVLKGYKSYELYGPQGICCRYTIYFKKSQKRLLLLAVEGPEMDGELSLRDYSTDNNKFPPGTIGALNWMNHPLVYVPLDADAQWFANEIRRQARVSKRQENKKTA